MLEIRTDDLRFTLEEATGLLQKMLGPALSSTEVQTLNEHTEGWAVGLKMAALSLRGEPDIAAFMESFTGSQRYIMDYLVEEVLKRQPDEVRDFLLKTSVLGKLTALLCDFITGHKGSQDMLMRLEQSNLFVVPLDRSRQWYRYHHLFAELLHHQLEGTYGAEEISRLHGQASRWYEEHGLIDDAVHHALAAPDWRKAISLIAAVAKDRTRKGEIPTLLAWLRHIPTAVLRGHRQLYHRYSYVLEVAGQLEDAEHALRDLERTTPGDSGEAAGFVISHGGLARRRGDNARAIELLERALSMLPPDNVALRARAAMVLGFVLLESTDRLDESFARLSEAFDLGRQAADDWLAAGASTYMSWIFYGRGQLDACVQLSRQVIEMVGLESAASLYCELGLVHYERNDIEGADRTQQLAVEGSELRGNAEAGLFSYPGLAWDRLALGDVAGAEAMMEKGDRLAKHPTVSVFSRACYAAMRVMFAIRLNDMAAAEVWFGRVSQYSDPLPFPMVHVPARFSIARGDMVAARRQLRSAYGMAAGAGAWGIVILIRVYQALAADSPNESLAFLSEALKLGEPRGYIRTFVDEGKLLKPLLEKALSQGITPDYTHKLLDIIETEESRGQARNALVAPHAPRGLVSDRELDILRLVAAGLSNRQIADRLIITPGTAKRHVHNIFEKLDARDRLQAVNRARELNLI